MRIIQHFTRAIKHRRVQGARFILPVSLFLFSCAAEAAPAPLPPLKVGVVLVPGSQSEGSFNRQTVIGVEGALAGGRGEFAIREAAGLREAEAHIKDLVSTGYTHIVVTGPSAADTVFAATERNPNVTFTIVDFSFDPALPRVQGMIFREDQAAYLAGALAGRVSRSQIVGVVAGRDVPRVRKHRNGFENGVKAVCPACLVIGHYLDSDDDRVGAEAAAEAQISAGADVIFGVDGATGAAAIRYAAARGVLVIGSETDAYLTVFGSGEISGADRVLTSAVKRVDTAVRLCLEARLSSAFTGGTQFFDVSNDGVGLAPFHEAEAFIPSDVLARLEEIRVGLAEGKIETGVDFETGEK